MEHDQLDVGDEQRPQSLEQRSRGRLGALERHQQPPERAGRDQLRGHDHDRLVRVLEDVTSRAPDRTPTAGRGAGADDRGDHLRRAERGEQRGLHRIPE